MLTPTRTTALAATLAAALALGACGGSGSSHKSVGGKQGPEGPPPKGTTTSAPPVVAATTPSVAAFCDQVRQIQHYYAGTGTPAEIQKVMPALNRAVQIAPPQIKADVTLQRDIIGQLAQGQRPKPTPKLVKAIEAETAFVKAHC